MNVLGDEALVTLWTGLEQIVGIICACLPAWRSLIGWIFPKLKLTINMSALRKQSQPSQYFNLSPSGNKRSQRSADIQFKDGSSDTVLINSRELAGSEVGEGSKVVASSEVEDYRWQ
jgi:hypothetical protein